MRYRLSRAKEAERSNGSSRPGTHEPEARAAIECRVTEVKELGSHHMFLAEVTGVSVDEQWLNERGSLELAKAEPIVYSHGGYYGLSELLGTFGWSVKKKKRCQR